MRRKKKCVAQAGLELVILLPLPPSANPTGVRHHNRRRPAAKQTYSNLTNHDDTRTRTLQPSRPNPAQRTAPNIYSKNTHSQRRHTPHTHYKKTLTLTLSLNTNLYTPYRPTPFQTINFSLHRFLAHSITHSLTHRLPRPTRRRAPDPSRSRWELTLRVPDHPLAADTCRHRRAPDARRLLVQQPASAREPRPASLEPRAPLSAPRCSSCSCPVAVRTPLGTHTTLSGSAQKKLQDCCRLLGELGPSSLANDPRQRGQTRQL